MCQNVGSYSFFLQRLNLELLEQFLQKKKKSISLISKKQFFFFFTYMDHIETSYLVMDNL